MLDPITPAVTSLAVGCAIEVAECDELVDAEIGIGCETA